MRPLLLATLTAFAGICSASAQQLSILPQVGFENARTSVQFDSRASFSPLGAQLSPQAGVRIKYSSKSGSGVFLGASTSRAATAFTFSQEQSGADVFKASPGDLRLHLEGGYQFSTKPIYFGKTAPVKAAAISSAANYTPGRCGGYYGGHCHRNSAAAMPAKPAKKGWYVSIQPLAGLALVPSTNPALSPASINGQPAYTYQAGNWTSAAIAGAGFEFGQDVQSRFTLTVQYFKGLGNLGTKNVATTVGGKATITDLKSSISGWNLTAGIPITLYKKKSVSAIKAAAEQKSAAPQRRCMGYYHYRCTRSISL